MTQYYKILKDMKSCNGGKHIWVPYEWTPKVNNPKLCRCGYHVVKQPYKMWWSWGCDVWKVKVRGIVDSDDDKTVCKQAMITEMMPKPSWLIDVEKFVDGLKNVKWFKPDGNPNPEWKLFTGKSWGAARDAAWDAVWDAAWDAARDAARDAAWDAVWDAAWNAAWESA